MNQSEVVAQVFEARANWFSAWGMRLPTLGDVILQTIHPLPDGRMPTDRDPEDPRVRRMYPLCERVMADIQEFLATRPMGATSQEMSEHIDCGRASRSDALAELVRQGLVFSQRFGGKMCVYFDDKDRLNDVLASWSEKLYQTRAGNLEAYLRAHGHVARSNTHYAACTEYAIAVEVAARMTAEGRIVETRRGKNTIYTLPPCDA